MYCLKCGRETGSEQIFCDSCLSLMRRYPVKIDAAVHLPQRSTEPISWGTAPRKRPPTIEEHLENAKKRNRWLIGAVIVLSVALTLATFFLFRQSSPLPFHQQVGRNYTINPSAH